MYKIMYSKLALKQIKNLKSANLFKKFENIIKIIKDNPYQIPPPYEKLSGELKTAYSRRINLQHRLVYEVNNETKKIYILSVWTHYEL